MDGDRATDLQLTYDPPLNLILKITNNIARGTLLEMEKSRNQLIQDSLFFFIIFIPQPGHTPPLLFGLPLLLLPCTSIPITLFPTYSSSLIITCPYHRILRSWAFFEISPTFVLPLIFSFLILSNLVTPHTHRNIFISATSIFFSFAFFNASVSAPYTISRLTIVL